MTPTFNLTTNVDELVKRMERRVRTLQPAVKRATTEATRTVYAESRKQMNELIYDKPVPTVEEVARENATIAIQGKKAQAVLGTFITTKTGKVVCIPIGKKQAKKKAWRRTGNLRRSEKMQIVSPAEGIISNDAGYAKHRHDMGKPGKRKTRYPAPWRANAVRTCRAKVRLIYRKHVLNALTGGV
jgi:hypothetical protein